MSLLSCYGLSFCRQAGSDDGAVQTLRCFTFGWCDRTVGLEMLNLVSGEERRGQVAHLTRTEGIAHNKCNSVTNLTVYVPYQKKHNMITHKRLWRKGIRMISWLVVGPAARV
jgi:hypothetical protein